MPLHRDTLHAGLLAENAALRTFIEVLRNEPQTLLKGETDLLALFGEPKARLVLELTRLGEQRLQWLRGQGVTADRSGMDQLLSKYYAVDSPDARPWEHLLQLATTANQLNTSNGLLIAARLNTTQRALNTLFCAARIPAAYAPDGSTIGFRTAHQIAVA